ncbi:hypothetical protein CAI21_22545 [Alkalilimnicola ehrlichii]|uniref:Uncharacterized protein n=2 Tax=Alkalilimnicola ehrlichii TaxID=351052 RepID=A0A3E0WH44_9GAMM|nr:hypothetical protein CAI21_22545 [Alkalilimnicola ehrlichii]RFA30844.1 hypothetical protein CAL65_22705 [Alkalilimnicola ehrlichii]
MGRKENAGLQLVSQGITEMDVLEQEIIDQMPLRNFLYRQAGHAAIADRVKMPSGPRAVWEDMPNPLGLPWRPAIRSVGDRYYNLHLSFPQMLLDTANTDPSILDLKEDISRRSNDFFERLRLFRTALESNTPALNPMEARHA